LLQTSKCCACSATIYIPLLYFSSDLRPTF
jgi:hypothetical protein